MSKWYVLLKSENDDLEVSLKRKSVSKSVEVNTHAMFSNELDVYNFLRKCTFRLDENMNVKLLFADSKNCKKGKLIVESTDLIESQEFEIEELCQEYMLDLECYIYERLAIMKSHQLVKTPFLLINKSGEEEVIFMWKGSSDEKGVFLKKQTELENLIS